jgi:hypothetical protein
MEFDAPEGFEMPEGLAEGDTFDAMATLKLGEEGKLVLVSLDGVALGGSDEEEEDDEEGEEGKGPPQGGFLASAEQGIADMMG